MSFALKASNNLLKCLEASRITSSNPTQPKSRGRKGGNNKACAVTALIAACKIPVLKVAVSNDPAFEAAITRASFEV